MQPKSVFSLCMLTIMFLCTAGSDDFVISFDQMRYYAQSHESYGCKSIEFPFSHEVEKLTFK